MSQILSLKINKNKQETNLMHISNKKIFLKDLNREKLWKLFL